MNLTPEYRDHVNQLIAKACIENEVYELIGKITWSFSSQLTSSMGYAYYDTNSLRFSWLLWDKAGKEEQDNTIVHEATHLIAAHIYGKQIKPHGLEWQFCMARAGYKPTRCHNIDTSEFRRKQKKYLAKCSCMVHTISANRRGRICNGKNYICNKCKDRLKLV